MLYGLCLLYIGLQLIDMYFDLHWKEFTIGVLILSLTITILSFLSLSVVGGLIWVIITLIEYKNYLNHIEE